MKTLTEFRTMSITPYNVKVFRDEKWVEVISSDLVPGDIVSIRESAKFFLFQRYHEQTLN